MKSIIPDIFGMNHAFGQGLNNIGLGGVSKVMGMVEDPLQLNAKGFGFTPWNDPRMAANEDIEKANKAKQLGLNMFSTLDNGDDQ